MLLPCPVSREVDYGFWCNICAILCNIGVCVRLVVFECNRWYRRLQDFESGVCISLNRGLRIVFVILGNVYFFQSTGDQPKSVCLNSFTNPLLRRHSIAVKDSLLFSQCFAIELSLATIEHSNMQLLEKIYFRAVPQPQEEVFHVKF